MVNNNSEQEKIENGAEKAVQAMGIKGQIKHGADLGQ